MREQTEPAPENQRVRLTKALLKEALLDLLETKPLPEVGVSELCRTAGINRSTFYAHYGNPRDLFEDVVANMVAGMEGALDAVATEQPLSLGHHVEAICTYLRAHTRVAKLVFAAADDIPNLARNLTNLSNDRANSFDALLAGYDGQTRALLGTYLAYGTYHLVKQWLLDDMDKTPAELGALAEHAALHGWASGPTA